MPLVGGVRGDGWRTPPARGGAILGPCGGPMRVAGKVSPPPQGSLGLANIAVIRNAYGRQVASDIRHQATALAPAPLEMVFIRAPIIARTGPEVDILASSDGKPVLVRQDRILVATFHPELTADTTVHEYFLRMVSQPNGNHAKSDNSLASPSGLTVESR